MQRKIAIKREVSLTVQVRKCMLNGGYRQMLCVHLTSVGSLNLRKETLYLRKASDVCLVG